MRVIGDGIDRSQRQSSAAAIAVCLTVLELRYKDRKKLNFFKKSDKVLFCVPFAPIAKWRREPTNFHAYAGRYPEMRENATSPMKK
jgi:hypothetical protein